MATYEEVAPDLSKIATEAQAKALKPDEIAPVKPTYRKLVDLTAPERTRVLNWLKWRPAHGQFIPAPHDKDARLSAEQMAAKLQLDPDVVGRLLVQAAVVVAGATEVAPAPVVEPIEGGG